MARLFQFRLRTMFLLTTLVAVACVAGPSIMKVLTRQPVIHEVDWGRHGVVRYTTWRDGTRETQRVKYGWQNGVPSAKNSVPISISTSRR